MKYAEEIILAFLLVVVVGLVVWVASLH